LAMKRAGLIYDNCERIVAADPGFEHIPVSR
jgi:hypothetical protein